MLSNQEEIKILYHLLPVPHDWIEGRPVFDTKEQYVLYMAIREKIMRLKGEDNE